MCIRDSIEALEQVQPEDLPPAAIEPRLGAVWIPALDVEAVSYTHLDVYKRQAWALR